MWGGGEVNGLSPSKQQVNISFTRHTPHSVKELSAVTSSFNQLVEYSVTLYAYLAS